MQERHHEERRNDTDGDVDEEAPSPGIVIRDPSTKCWAKCRRDNDAKEEDGLYQPLLLSREDLPDRGLGRREECRATRALQNAPAHELDEARRRTTEERRDHEDDDRRREVVPPSEHHGQIRGDWEDDDVREDVAGADPADLLLGGAEVAGHLGESHIDDGGVEHLHDRGGDEGQENEPPILFDRIGI